MTAHTPPLTQIGTGASVYSNHLQLAPSQAFQARTGLSSTLAYTSGPLIGENGSLRDAIFKCISYPGPLLPSCHLNEQPSTTIVF